MQQDEHGDVRLEFGFGKVMPAQKPTPEVGLPCNVRAKRYIGCLLVRANSSRVSNSSMVLSLGRTFVIECQQLI